jgi:GAF domain-containing protein
MPESYTHLKKRVADRTRELAALNAIATAASRSMDLQEILNDALDKTLEVLDTKAGGVYILDQESGGMTTAIHRGLTREFVEQLHELQLEEGLSENAVKSDQPLLVTDISTVQRINGLAVNKEGFHSLISAPISSKEKVLGRLFTVSRGYREFADQDVQLLASIGHQIAVAVENARLFEAEKRRAEQFRAISEVGRQIISILDVDQLLEEIVGQVSEILGYYLVGIGLTEGDEVIIKTGAGPYWETGNRQPLRFKVSQEGIVGQVAGTGQPLLATDVSQEPHYYQVPQITETRSELAVPLRTKDQVIGVLDIQSRRLDAFDDNDLVVLQSLANQAAMAIENARLFEEKQKQAEQVRLINEVGRSLNSILAVDELLKQMTQLIQATMGYHRVSIGLIEGDDLVFKAALGPGWESLEDRHMRLKVGREGVTGWVASTGQPLLVPDASQEPRFVPTPVSPPSESELAVPLKTKDSVIGVLNVESVQLDAFDQSDMAVLQSLANQAAMAIENARLFEAEQRQAEQFRLINEVGRRMTSILDIDELLNQIARMIQETFDYYRVEFGLVDGDEVAVLTTAARDWDRVQATGRLENRQQGFTDWMVSGGQPSLALDGGQEPRYVQPGDSQTGSELAVPITAKGKVTAVLNVVSDQPDAFNERDVVVLQSLANQVSVAVENAHLYQQAQQLAVMEERQRLARDLHDSVTQSLYGMALYSEAAAGQLSLGDLDRVAEHLGELQETAQEALTEMRLLVYELRAPVLEEEGLVAALQARLLAVERRLGLNTEFKVEGEIQLQGETEEGLYRIAQEALNNALKHADARNIRLSLCQDEHIVTLEIADDGIGFDPLAAQARGGLGLEAMRERVVELGGQLMVQTKLGEGTQVQAKVSL